MKNFSKNYVRKLAESIKILVFPLICIQNHLVITEFLLY